MRTVCPHSQRLRSPLTETLGIEDLLTKTNGTDQTWQMRRHIWDLVSQIACVGVWVVVVVVVGGGGGRGGRGRGRWFKSRNVSFVY